VKSGGQGKCRAGLFRVPREVPRELARAQQHCLGGISGRGKYSCSGENRVDGLAHAGGTKHYEISMGEDELRYSGCG